MEEANTIRLRNGSDKLESIVDHILHFAQDHCLYATREFKF